jgi:hypothetical protein
MTCDADGDEPPDPSVSPDTDNAAGTKSLRDRAVAGAVARYGLGGSLEPASSISS